MICLHGVKADKYCAKCTQVILDKQVRILEQELDNLKEKIENDPNTTSEIK